MLKYCCLFFFVFFFNYSVAQNSENDLLKKKSSKNKVQYFNSTQFYFGLHPLEPINEPLIGISNINGIVIDSNTYIGIGVSVNDYGAFPLYLHLKYNFSQLPKSFYIATDAGLTFQDDNKALFIGGIIFQPSFGCNFYTFKKIKLNIGAGILFMSYRDFYKNFSLKNGNENSFLAPSLNVGLTF